MFRKKKTDVTAAEVAFKEGWSIGMLDWFFDSEPNKSKSTRDIGASVDGFTRTFGNEGPERMAYSLQLVSDAITKGTGTVANRIKLVDKEELWVTGNQYSGYQHETLERQDRIWGDVTLNATFIRPKNHGETEIEAPSLDWTLGLEAHEMAFFENVLSSADSMSRATLEARVILPASHHKEMGTTASYTNIRMPVVRVWLELVQVTNRDDLLQNSAFTQR